MTQFHNVNSLMRFVWISAIATVALLAGCGRDSKQAPVEMSGATKPAINTDRQMTPEEAEAALEKASSRNEEALARTEIAKPGEKGWKPSKDGLGELGAALDTTFAGMNNARCEGRITYAIPLGTMDIQLAADIQDEQTFHVAFVLPEHPDSMNRAIGNGERRAMLLADEWKELPSYSRNGGTVKMDEKGLEKFEIAFPQLMWSQYTEGKSVWEPLFSALQKGVGGYKARVERQIASRNDEERSMIRVYASTEEGEPTQIEVIIDESHMLPVTVRVVKQLEDGERTRIMWTGAWAFGGKYKPNAFVIPVPEPN